MEEQILTLNKMGFNILEIINPNTNVSTMFLYDTFVPVDSIGGSNRSFKHKIKGKEVTKFLRDRASVLNINISPLDENILRSNINALRTISVEYSSHFLWINYLSA